MVSLTRSGMVFDILEHRPNSFSRAQPVDQVDQVEVWQLAVEALHLDVEVSHGGFRDLQVNGGLNGASPCRQVPVILLAVFIS